MANNVRVRICFRSEIYFEGESLEDVAKQWERIELFSEEANNHYACELNLMSVEMEESSKDVTNEFNSI